MAIFIEECNVDFDGDIITCIPIRNGSGKKCPTIKVNFERELLLNGPLAACLEKAVEDEKEMRG